MTFSGLRNGSTNPVIGVPSSIEETVGILIGLAIIIIDYSQNSSIIYSVSLK
jgi:hypothetical protein